MSRADSKAVRLSRQPDKFLILVEVFPRLPIDLDALDGPPIGMAEAQKGRLGWIAQRHFDGGCDFAIVHAGGDFVRDRAEASRGIHCPSRAFGFMWTGHGRQKRYFNPNWIRRGATEVCVITPKFAVPSVVPGLANWGWLREL